MKIKIAIALLFASMLSAFGQTNLTPFYYQGYNSDGTPQTNPLTFQAFPPINGVVVIGTNVYSGGVNPTFTPNANGFFMTNIAANGYRITIPAQSLVFYANIPQITAITNSLGVYITNQPVIPGPIAGYSIVTNNLGFAPATNAVPLTTTSNPTNSFAVNTIYTAPVFKSELTGFTLGGILYYTNNSISYQTPVTNNFTIPLSTNATWSLLGVNLTNCIDWTR